MISAKTILVLMMAAVGTGCIPFGDPEGPGASGSISLGKGADPSAFKTLKITAIADTGAPFDPARPVFTAPASAASETWEASNEDLTTVTFPHDYLSGDALGTTEVQRWRLFAWLSAQPEPIKRPDLGSNEGAEPFPMSGEPYGTTLFEVDGCGSFGGFCSVTKGVNLSLDQTAP
jgi:hypothetical protein